MCICTRSFESGRRLLIFLIASLLPIAVSAIEVDDLYVAEVLVTDESPRQLRAGSRAGLLQVLVRVSGNIRVEEQPLVRNAMRRPSDYYYQYSYESTDRTLLVDGEDVPAKLLRLHFEPSAVARLLRDADLPVWGSNRPGVLFWVAVNEGKGRRILNEADASEVVTSLLAQADRRGLPVLFPILDLEDTSQISTAEVWGAFLDRIKQASGRYEPDAVVTARIQEASGRWSGKWSYWLAGEWRPIESVASSARDLVHEMVDRIADALAARYALDSSRATITVRVEGVSGLEDYAAVSAYLQKLAPVLNSSIVALQNDVARFELKIEGQTAQLVEIIELDERLVLLNQAPAGGRLLYRWQTP